MHPFLRLIYFALLISFSSFAQHPLFNFEVPAHFTLLDTASCDLNKDGFGDYIVILKNDFENLHPDTARPLLILFGDRENKLTLVGRNDNVVLCKNCGGIMGDPYQGIIIRGNHFSISHYGGSAWRWSRDINFKFEKTKNAFILHLDGGVSYNTSDPDKTEEYFLNKDDFDNLPFEKYHYDKTTE